MNLISEQRASMLLSIVAIAVSIWSVINDVNSSRPDIRTTGGGQYGGSLHVCLDATPNVEGYPYIVYFSDETGLSSILDVSNVGGRAVSLVWAYIDHSLNGKVNPSLDGFIYKRMEDTATWQSGHYYPTTWTITDFADVTATDVSRWKALTVYNQANIRNVPISIQPGDTKKVAFLLFIFARVTEEQLKYVIEDFRSGLYSDPFVDFPLVMQFGDGTEHREILQLAISGLESSDAINTCPSNWEL